MTWMTPLEAFTSAFTTVALPTGTPYRRSISPAANARRASLCLVLTALLIRMDSPSQLTTSPAARSDSATSMSSSG